MHDLSDKFWLGVSAIAIWLTGEAGKAAVAGAAGGVLRVLMQDRFRFRDGAVSVVGGVIAAIYLGPVVGAILSGAVGPVADPAAAGFIAGLAGMSLAKIIVAVVEAQAARMARKGGDE